MAEILSINRVTRTVWLDQRPMSKREVMSLILAWWHDEEVDYHIGEVMDFPNKVFFKVEWKEEQHEMDLGNEA